MRPVHVKCQVELRVKKNEVYVAEMFSGDNRDKIYQVWMADLWECPGCEDEFVYGYGQRPILEHYQADFAERWQQIQQEPAVRIIHAWVKPYVSATP